MLVAQVESSPCHIVLLACTVEAQPCECAWPTRGVSRLSVIEILRTPTTTAVDDETLARLTTLVVSVPLWKASNVVAAAKKVDFDHKPRERVGLPACAT